MKFRRCFWELGALCWVAVLQCAPTARAVVLVSVKEERASADDERALLPARARDPGTCYSHGMSGVDGGYGQAASVRVIVGASETTLIKGEIAELGHRRCDLLRVGQP